MNGRIREAGGIEIMASLSEMTLYVVEPVRPYTNESAYRSVAVVAAVDSKYLSDASLLFASVLENPAKRTQQIESVSRPTNSMIRSVDPANNMTARTAVNRIE
jgi:hypothetical protein